MPYLIDSNWVVEHLAGEPAAVDLLRQLAPDGLFISIITYMEVFEGALSSPDPRLAQARFQDFLQGIRVLTISRAIAR